jgi:hypothetical protein
LALVQLTILTDTPHTPIGHMATMCRLLWLSLRLLWLYREVQHFLLHQYPAVLK